jgi:hypothetical protein
MRCRPPLEGGDQAVQHYRQHFTSEERPERPQPGRVLGAGGRRQGGRLQNDGPDGLRGSLDRPARAKVNTHTTFGAGRVFNHGVAVA